MPADSKSQMVLSTRIVLTAIVLLADALASVPLALTAALLSLPSWAVAVGCWLIAIPIGWVLWARVWKGTWLGST